MTPQQIASCVGLIAGLFALIAFFDCWGAIRAIRKDVRTLRELEQARAPKGEEPK